MLLLFLALLLLGSQCSQCCHIASHKPRLHPRLEVNRNSVYYRGHYTPDSWALLLVDRDYCQVQLIKGRCHLLKAHGHSLAVSAHLDTERPVSVMPGDLIVLTAQGREISNDALIEETQCVLQDDTMRFCPHEDHSVYLVLTIGGPPAGDATD